MIRDSKHIFCTYLKWDKLTGLLDLQDGQFEYGYFSRCLMIQDRQTERCTR